MADRIIQTETLTAIADAIRTKNGSSDTYTPAQMAQEIEDLSSVPFGLGEIPDYVKNEAYSVAQKVRAVQTAHSFTTIVWADPHHTASQVTGWQAQTNISTLHAAMGMAVVAAMCHIDAGMQAGDYTFGSGETTLALFEEQVKEINKYLDLSWSNIPAFYCVGNHDTGEYYLRDAGGDLYGAENIYAVIGGRNDDGTTVMGSTTYGYCYRDFPAKKIRVICLNTVEGETTGGYTGGQCSDAQLLWFAQALYSIGSNSDWGIIVVSHYPLDYGGNYKAGNIVYQYVNGGSVTYNNTTVNFSGHNAAKFVAQYHGHTHCLKTDNLHYIVNNSGTAFDAYRLATPSGTFFRNNEYAGLLVYGIDFGEATTYTKTADSGKDTAFVVNVYDPDAEVIHSICYGAGYDRTVSIGGITYWTISNTLTHTTNSNAATYVADGDPYTGTISADSGYSIDSLTVQMGGVDITASAVSGDTISIASVTGNIVITAVATKVYNYHNLVLTATDASGNIAPYADNHSISSNGDDVSGSGYNGQTLSGFIALANDNVKHVYRIGGQGITWEGTQEYNRIAWYDSNHALLGVVIAAKRLDFSQYYPSTVTEAGDLSAVAFKVTNAQGNVVSNVPASAAYFRISARGLGANLIITLDEIIDEL